MKRDRVIFALLVAAALLPIAAQAKDAAKGERNPIIDPMAERVLRNMGTFLGETPRFSVRADVRFDEVLASGQKIQISAVKDIAVRRPDRIFVAHEGDLGARRSWYDGKQVGMLDLADGVHASAPMPGKIDAMLWIITYFVAGGVYYRPYYSGSSTVYRVVANP